MKDQNSSTQTASGESDGGREGAVKKKTPHGYADRVAEKKSAFAGALRLRASPLDRSQAQTSGGRYSCRYGYWTALVLKSHRKQFSDSVQTGWAVRHTRLEPTDHGLPLVLTQTQHMAHKVPNHTQVVCAV